MPRGLFYFFPMKIVVLFVSLLLAVSAHAITGGVAVDPASPIARAVVVITEDHPGVQHHCTAILLREDIVLTAAHCADDLEPGKAGRLEFQVKTPTSLAACATSTVTEISYPPQMKHNAWAGVPNPDLALLRLKTKLCGTVPARIEDVVTATKHLRYRTAGYGEGTALRARWPDTLELTYPGLGKDEFLKKYYGPIRNKNYPEATGEKYYQWFKRLLAEFAPFERFLVPVVARTSICKGDSGGPVYREQDGRVFVMGVNSGALPHPEVGLDRCDNGFTQLIQPVAPHLAWLKAFLAR